MKLITRTKLIGALGLVVGSAAACTTSTSDDAGTSSVRELVTHEAETEGSTAPQPGETGAGRIGAGTRGQMGGSQAAEEQREHLGPVALIADALSKVGLNEEQRSKIDELGKKVTEKERGVMEARRNFQAALADQLRSGQIDESQLEDEIDALVRAREEASPVLRSALDDLHGILEPQQRTELVDALTSRMQEQSRDAEGWFDQFAQDLRLDEDQKTRIREILDRAKPSVEQDKDKFKKIFDAFKGEEFEINRVAPMRDVGKRTRERARGMVSIAKKVSEILKPDQREQLARRLKPQRGAHEPMQPQEPQTGQIQGGIIVGGGYRAGYRAGGFRGWGGGYRAGHVTVARGGYGYGYPFVGGYGYGMGVW